MVTRKVFHGTHEGQLMGIPPTGREVEIHVIDIVRLEDGRIVEHWNIVDRLGLLQQPGAIRRRRRRRPPEELSPPRPAGSARRSPATPTASGRGGPRRLRRAAPSRSGGS